MNTSVVPKGKRKRAMQTNPVAESLSIPLTRRVQEYIFLLLFQGMDYQEPSPLALQLFPIRNIELQVCSLDLNILFLSWIY